MCVVATRASSSICGRIVSGPSAQFMPTANSGTCDTAFQNASTILPGDKRTAAFAERAGNHHRHAFAAVFKILIDREQAGFEVQRIDDRFRQQDIDPPFDKGGDLFVIRIDHRVERPRPENWRRRPLSKSPSV